MKTKTWSDFESLLADGIRGFLVHKRALGKRYRGEEEYFRLLDRYLVAQQVTTVTAITPALIEAFLVSRPYAPRSFNTHLAMLRRLFAWLVLQAVVSESPVHALRRPELATATAIYLQQHRGPMPARGRRSAATAPAALPPR